jgi:hypothetical protein
MNKKISSKIKYIQNNIFRKSLLKKGKISKNKNKQQMSDIN